MKILFQRLWELKVEWDQEIPEELQHKHTKWKNQLHLFKTLPFNRCYFRTTDYITAVKLHRFSDASENAYAAVAYLRATYDSGPPTMALVAAKTKVAPLKRLSIPRLELCGAQLLAKLLTTVRQALNIKLEKTFTWADSTIVLHWLDGSSRRFKTFMGNRVSTILSLLPAGSWTHVPTNSNPADCASRGLLPEELINHSRWWHGTFMVAGRASTAASTTSPLSTRHIESCLQHRVSDLSRVDRGPIQFLLQVSQRHSMVLKIYCQPQGKQGQKFSQPFSKPQCVRNQVSQSSSLHLLTESFLLR